MNNIRFGNQTYTWQMNIQKYQGALPQIIEVTKRGNLAGIEPELCMLGDFWEKPWKLAEILTEHQLKLAALSLTCDWQEPDETDVELELANKTISMLVKYFPDTVLNLGQMAGKDRQHLAIRQKNAISCLNAVSKRATECGIVAVFHPNSATGSIFRIDADYDFMFEHIDCRTLGFAPDSGHIAKGGMDPVAVIKDHLSIIRHVHFKDMDSDGNWVKMGQGIIDFLGILEALKEYSGWVMIEDESSEALIDPDQVAIDNGLYINKLKEEF